MLRAVGEDSTKWIVCRDGLARGPRNIFTALETNPDRFTNI